MELIVARNSLMNANSSIEKIENISVNFKPEEINSCLLYKIYWVPIKDACKNAI